MDKIFDNQDYAPNNGEIVLYNPDDTIRLEVRMNDETVWLNRNQIAVLFGRDVKTIGKHINNALREELDGLSVVANFATTASDGKTYQVEYYNLDMILSIGYRVKSRQGIQFRQWANRILKEYLLKGYNINNYLASIEYRIDNTLQEHSRQISELQKQVNFFVKTSLPPVEGIFFDGQIFDAYEIVCRLIKSATRRIVLIDNYVDETTLKMLAKRTDGVTATIYTQSIGEQLQLDIDRHNAQYPQIVVKRLKKSHDRFLILDDELYSIGASLKDMGKKWFAILKMQETKAEEILTRV